MKYLLTYNEGDTQKAYYTNWFDVENNFNPEVNMIVFDLFNHKYLYDEQKGWLEIEEDHL
jgi:hypothetical protein